MDVQLICAMGPPGGGRNAITENDETLQRALYHRFSENDIVNIFTTLMTWNMERVNFDAEIKGDINSLIQATLSVYKQSQSTLLPTPKSHYTFNLRDFSKIIQGICMVEGAMGV